MSWAGPIPTIPRGPRGRTLRVMLTNQMWPHRSATATEDLIVDTGVRQAQARFVSLLHGNWLAQASENAYGETVTGLLRVGPAGSVSAKLVRVSFLDPIYRDDTMSVGLRWEAAGAAGSLFPVLDATITICPEGEKAARLALVGSYRPRWGTWVPPWTPPSCTE